MKHLVHKALHHLYKEEKEKFLRALNQPEAEQNSILQESLHYSRVSGFWNSLDSIQSYSEFVKKIPVTNYSFFQEKIANPGIRRHPQWKRWEPTSGSTQSRKWIPYNRAFLSQLNRASSPWLADLYENHPGIQKGTHYWSLSWLPQDLRKDFGTDDSELFPFWQKIFLKQIFPVPSRLAKTPSMKAFWFATLVYLAGQRDLTMISVWSPTFLLQVVKDLRLQWEAVRRTLETGRWSLYETELSGFRAAWRNDLPILKSPQFLAELWPQLSLISSWDTASSKSFAKELRDLFPQIPLQGKGLWATEAVVTIPFQQKYPLAIRSHFYEFRNLDDEKILPLQKLKVGMHVQPIVSSANGFLRYEIEDVLKVDGFVDQTPSLFFMGRRRGVDMVGEKMDHVLAQKILDRLNEKFEGRFFSLRAYKEPDPHYKLICASRHESEQIENALEECLKEIHHYALALELNQLGRAKVLNFQDETQALQSLSKSTIHGQNKVEPLSCDF